MTDGLVIRNVTKQDTFANYTCTILDRLTLTPMGSSNIRLRLRHRSGIYHLENSKTHHESHECKCTHRDFHVLPTGKFLETVSLQEPARENKVKVWGILKHWVQLQCNVFSRPSPLFEWKKQGNGDKISDLDNVYKIVEDESTSNLTVNAF